MPFGAVPCDIAGLADKARLCMHEPPSSAIFVCTSMLAGFPSRTGTSRRQGSTPLRMCHAGTTNLLLTSQMLWRRAGTARMSWQSGSLTPQVSCLHHSLPDKSHATKCKD